jgi:hypothetical protein
MKSRVPACWSLRAVALTISGLAALAVLAAMAQSAAAADPPAPRLWIVSGSAAAARSGALQQSAMALPFASAGGAVTVDAGRSFDLVGISLPCPPARASRYAVDVRVSADGARWTPWWPVAVEASLSARGAALGQAPASSDPVWTGPGKVLQYRLSIDGRIVSAAVARAAGVGVPRFCFIASEPAAGDAAAAAAAPLSAAPLGAAPQPAIVLRGSWADSSVHNNTPSYATIEMAFVHHTDNGNSYSSSQSASIVRGIYAYHTRALGWSDIGYNFLIDKYGTIFEGRYGGITKGVIGAQCLGFNTGSVGVSVIGNFTSAAPPSAAIKSLENLLAWKLDVHHVNPLGKGTLTCGYGEKFATGQRVTFNAIAGHRDACFTSCPGTAFYRLLPTIRKVVAGIGLPKIYDLTLSGSVVSPNDDGVADAISAKFALSGICQWNVVVTSSTGAIVAQVSGSGASGSATWNGRDAKGAALADGKYTLTASATDGTAVARSATAGVTIDTVAPVLAVPAPVAFSPNRDGFQDSALLDLTVNERCYVRAALCDKAGKELRVLRDWALVSAGKTTFTWDGRLKTATGWVPATDGGYVVSYAAKDLGGNAAATRSTVTVNDTVGFARAAPPSLSPNGDGRADTGVLACTLARGADVSLALWSGTRVVRQIDLGARAAGVVSWVWDGKDSSGRLLPQGRYAYLFTASNEIGTATAGGSVRIDLAKPTFTVPARSSATHGRYCAIAVSVHDALSRVRVTAVARNSAGAVVGRYDSGWLPSGTRRAYSFKPPAAGVYRLTFSAVDWAQNKALARVCAVKAK